MVKVIHFADDGTEMAAIEVDDFTIEVIYSGIAEMLRHAASNETRPAPGGELPAAARRRREKILSRIRDRPALWGRAVGPTRSRLGRGAPDGHRVRDDHVAV